MSTLRVRFAFMLTSSSNHVILDVQFARISIMSRYPHTVALKMKTESLKACSFPLYCVLFISKFFTFLLKCFSKDVPTMRRQRRLYKQQKQPEEGITRKRNKCEDLQDCRNQVAAMQLTKSSISRSVEK